MIQSESDSLIETLEAWYDSLENSHPFELEVKSYASEGSKAFRAVSIFPWDVSSLNSLWNGEFSSEPNKVAQWQKICHKWSGVVAVGGGSKLRLFLSRPHQPYLPICNIEVPEVLVRFGDEERLEEPVITCATWCMVQNADEFWPLITFSSNRILYLYNVEKASYHGVLRGHGGQITSLAVHPVDPCILASTSYDHTCRIYDLTKRAECKIDNPHWPGKSVMVLGGAPFGLRSNEPEGIDYGRCIAVLVGGPSGGHQAPVLDAAFHPSYPIIATCGMDHAMKLWYCPVTSGDRISREDKPLFSSTAIHSAQVLSIICKDMLLTSCGDVFPRLKEPDPLKLEPGTLVLWKWLGLDRFFPPDREIWPTMYRGCASDYQDSSSYKVIAEYTLPQRHPSSRPFVFQTSSHTPLIALPSVGCIRLASVRHFKPRLPPSFTFRKEGLVEAANKLSLDAENRTTGHSKKELPHWTVEAMQGHKNGDGDRIRTVGPPHLEACAIAENGRLLIGVGPNEGIWIWRIPRGRQVRRVSTSPESEAR